jgi:hypothetical protein
LHCHSPQAKSSAPGGVKVTKVPDSCILSQPRSIASLRPAPYSAGLPRSRNRSGSLIFSMWMRLELARRCWRFRGFGARLFPGRRRGGRWRILCGGLVFLVQTTRHDPDRIVEQWSLQRLGFIPRRVQSRRASFLGQAYHRHGLGNGSARPRRSAAAASGSSAVSAVRNAI